MTKKGQTDGSYGEIEANSIIINKMTVYAIRKKEKPISLTQKNVRANHQKAYKQGKRREMTPKEQY